MLLLQGLARNAREIARLRAHIKELETMLMTTEAQNSQGEDLLTETLANRCDLTQRNFVVQHFDMVVLVKWLQV